MTKVRHQDLTDLLARRGPLPSREVVALLGITRTTLMRLMNAPGCQARSFGQTRSAVYAVPRAVNGVEAPIPMFEIDADGAARQTGELHPIAPDGFITVFLDGRIEIHPGLPAWVEDLRPQGYIGRHFPSRHADLNLPTRLQDWSGDHMLAAIARRVPDGSGNLVIGHESFARLTELPARNIRESDLVALARDAGGTIDGSSAGGEFPKFMTQLDGEHVLVKFVEANGQPDKMRWFNLLACEHVALSVTAQNNIAAARARIVDRDGFRFLIVSRFDRVGVNGRKGMISMQAIHDGYIDKSCSTWLAVAEEMLRTKLITQTDVDHIGILTAFSIAIGNTDRHFGNISFMTNRDSMSLSPAYDILPMVLQPADTRLPYAYEINLGSVPARYWSAGISMATQFWRTLLDTRLITEDFQVIARAALDHVAATKANYRIVDHA